MAEISIVCGLGNPDPRYHATRHNLGFMALDRVSERHFLSWKSAPGPAHVAPWRVSGRTVSLLKPLTHMNESGVALERHGAAATDALLVVCDDLNLPLGQLRFRPGGGSGGHKGLESIIERLGSSAFPRLRLGIGAPPPGVDWVEFVLSGFAADERGAADGLVETAADAIETAVRSGLGAAMQRFNGGADPPGDSSGSA